MSKCIQQKHRGLQGPTKEKIKTDVKEKVREIRLRQQNWMKQREELQKQPKEKTAPNKSFSDPQESIHPSSRNTVKNVGGNNNHHSNNQHQTTQNGGTPSKSSMQPKGGFKSWLQSRQTDDKRTVTANETVIDSDGRETNLLRLNSDRSVECATPDPGWSRDQVLGPSSTRSKQLSEITSLGGGHISSSNDVTSETRPWESLTSIPGSYNQYETLADEIISRVKNNLYINNRKDSINTSTGRDKSSSVLPEADTSSNQLEPESPSQMAGHICPNCRKTMTPPHHVPMLIIPCGHTLCEECTKGRSLCLCCETPIKTSMVNLMLQQVIDDFYHEKLHKERQLIAKKSYQPLLYTETKNESYSESYGNLKTRREVLEQESVNLKENLREISQNVQKEQKQIENIQREETKLSNQITELTNRLHDLQGHRSEYEVKVTELGHQKEEMGRQLRLVQDSLSSVLQQMEKIEILQEGR